MFGVRVFISLILVEAKGLKEGEFSEVRNFIIRSRSSEVENGKYKRE